MFINMLGLNPFSLLGILMSTLGVFALGFAEGDEDEEKVVFKNQDAFNEVVEGRLAKQKKKILDEQELKLKEMKEDLEETISDLKDEIKTAKKEKTKKNDDDEDNPKLAELSKTVETLNKELKKITKEKEDAVSNAEKIQTTNREKTIQSTIVSLLSEAKVTAPNDIYLILKDGNNIVLDEDNNVIPVYANTDNQVVGSGGDPMDIKTFIDGWLKERPHFVSASRNKGSGAVSTDTSKLKPGEINDGDEEDKSMTLTDILNSDEHKEREKDVRESGSLQHGGDDIE